ncbi:MAG: 5-methylthioadenosine/S-adenosylhomocysteine deaminase [Archaeoglobaceae archaeon]|nr:5-methylthioadenosine/S-adenosylhomocysteine deaminase [Archaeoglobaceae archaeon]
MILIENAKVLRGEKLVSANILIDGNRISAIGEVKDRSDIVIDGKGLAVIPGLFNSHTHSAMTLFRGYAEDMPLQEWLEKKIWPAEARLNDEIVYWASKLACIEMLKSGTTFFLDMYFFPSATAKAVEETGIRACLSSAFFDFFNKDLLEINLKRVEKELKELKNYRVLRAIAPHAVYTVSIEGLRRAMELAEKENILVHFHLAETEKEVLDFRKKHGKGIVNALDEIGFLNSRLISAHCVWLEREEIRLMAERGVNAVHCPSSNMKLSVGKALNYLEMKNSGLNVLLGTDGAASNNSLDILREMKISALLQKFYYGADSFKASDAFKMATENASKAFGIKSGRIEVGWLADLVLLDIEKIPMTPCHDLISNLVYSASSECVDTVIVDGNIVIENGHFDGEEKVVETFSKLAEDFFAQFKT